MCNKSYPPCIHIFITCISSHHSTCGYLHLAGSHHIYLGKKEGGREGECECVGTFYRLERLLTVQAHNLRYGRDPLLYCFALSSGLHKAHDRYLARSQDSSIDS